MYKNNKIPMNIQFFAEGSGEGPEGQQTQNQSTVPKTEIDYEKLSQLVAGKQSVTEESVLKGYFKQQGLSKDEVAQAIADFKQQKAANEPDINEIQQQVSIATKQAQQAMIERDACFVSGELGIELETMPYVLKLADMSQVVGEDGSVNQDKLKEALNKVLEDVPQLKPQQEQNQSGFRQIGVGQQQTQQQQTQQQQQKTTATKRWNRWN